MVLLSSISLYVWVAHIYPCHCHKHNCSIGLLSLPPIKQPHWWVMRGPSSKVVQAQSLLLTLDPCQVWWSDADMQFNLVQRVSLSWMIRLGNPNTELFILLNEVVIVKSWSYPESLPNGSERENWCRWHCHLQVK